MYASDCPLSRSLRSAAVASIAWEFEGADYVRPSFVEDDVPRGRLIGRPGVVAGHRRMPPLMGPACMLAALVFPA